MRHWPALGCALACVAACTASADEVAPPKNELYFPTGIVVAPNEKVAFVTNANSELRYDSGSVGVLDMDEVRRIINDWVTNRRIPEGLCKHQGDDNEENCCEQDPDHSETLSCYDTLFLNRNEEGVRIGNFATDISVQDLGGGALRVIVPTRGDPSIAWANWDGSKLSCNENGQTNALCDDAHRLSYVQNDADLASIPEEPFNVFADSAGEFAMVTHLTTGAVTLIDSPKNSDRVQVADVLTGIFAADPANGLRGATGLVGRLPNQPDDVIYVGSRSEDRIQTFTVGRPVNEAPPYLLPGNWFFLDAVGGNNGGSSDTRGMAASVDGSRLYLVNRRPPTVQVWDTAITPTGFPRNKALGATDICRQGSTIAISGTGDNERGYVTCFQDGQIYVVDPRGDVSVEDIVLVGRGPYAASAARTSNLVLVTNFLEDTIAVVDTTPNAKTHNRVVLRIGKVRQP
jgi:DNA-binding beta-propeller fold protein YncE